MNAPIRDELAQQAFRDFPASMTVPAVVLDMQKLAITRSIVQRINTEAPGNYGLLVKTDQGNKIPSDIVVWADTLEHFDLLSDRDAGGDMHEIVYTGFQAKGVISNPAWRWQAVIPDTPLPPAMSPPMTGPEVPASTQELAELDVIKQALLSLGEVLQIMVARLTTIDNQLAAIATSTLDTETIAKELRGHLGQMPGVVDQMHNTTNRIGDIAAGLAPLLNLLTALRGR